MKNPRAAAGDPVPLRNLRARNLSGRNLREQQRGPDQRAQSQRIRARGGRKPQHRTIHAGRRSWTIPIQPSGPAAPESRNHRANRAKVRVPHRPDVPRSGPVPAHPRAAPPNPGAVDGLARNKAAEAGFGPLVLAQGIAYSSNVWGEQPNGGHMSAKGLRNLSFFLLLALIIYVAGNGVS